MKNPKTIKIRIDESPVSIVPRQNYVKAKTKQLRAFGYGNLTEKEVDEQIDAVLDDKTLTVIGMFIKDEIVK